MPYRYLDTIATADVAFEAWGKTQEEMFTAASDATMNVMVRDLGTIASREKRIIELKDDDLELALFRYLQEFLYYKDAEQLLLRSSKVELPVSEGYIHLRAEAVGEPLDPGKHDLVVDVKAVTMHQFSVTKTDGRWLARVILDI